MNNTVLKKTNHITEKGGFQMKGNQITMNKQDNLNSMTFFGGRQGDLDGGTWHAELPEGTFQGGRQGDLDGGTWHVELPDGIFKGGSHKKELVDLPEGTLFVGSKENYNSEKISVDISEGEKGSSPPNGICE